MGQFASRLPLSATDLKRSQKTIFMPEKCKKIMSRHSHDIEQKINKKWNFWIFDQKMPFSNREFFFEFCQRTFRWPSYHDYRSVEKRYPKKNPVFPTFPTSLKFLPNGDFFPEISEMVKSAIFKISKIFKICRFDQKWPKSQKTSRVPPLDPRFSDPFFGIL